MCARKEDNENYFRLPSANFKRFMILEIIEEKTILNVPFFLIRSIVNATDNTEKGQTCTIESQVKCNSEHYYCHY